MFIFGHLGIGSKLVSPWTKRLPKRWVFLGTLLPDLIDKPLYYGLSLATGKRSAELGLISGTRTVGHTGLLTLSVAFYAFARRSKAAAALSLGMASHLFLDNLSEQWMISSRGIESLGEPTTLWALLFPFLGVRFPVMPYENFSQHLASIGMAHLLIGEAVGMAILGWDYWKLAYSSEWRKEVSRYLRELRRQRFRPRRTSRKSK